MITEQRDDPRRLTEDQADRLVILLSDIPTPDADVIDVDAA